MRTQVVVGIRILDPGSRSAKNQPGPEFRIQGIKKTLDPGSRTQIRNTDEKAVG
jgi:hypothetical protein